MSWLLDTDVICQPIKRHGNQAVIRWLEREQANCFTSTVVIAQIACWIRTKQGRTRERLQRWLTESAEALEGRILSFNTSTAHVWAEQKVLLERKGQPMPIEDSYIAAPRPPPQPHHRHRQRRRFPSSGTESLQPLQGNV